MRRLSHTCPEARPAAASARTAPRESVGEAIGRVARALERAHVHFGHGTDNARDEAAELVFHAADLDHASGAAVYGKRLRPVRLARIERLLRERIARRVPLAYLTHRAFFAGLELYVDERVLVPRSPIAELALTRFAPWAKPRGVSRILDIGTGSGAIAIACAKAFPRALVDAADISAAALAVARRNVRRHRLASRVKLLRSDHFAQIPPRRYDIIVSNPPYVGRTEMRALPREYRHEPPLALASGRDGLDSVRAILTDAPQYLSRDGILVVEVGNTEDALLRAFPRVPFLWPEIAMGGGGVFVLRATDLQQR